MARFAPFLVLAVLIVCAVILWRAERRAPDRYAACAKMSDPVEIERCRSSIDFALSAGW